MEQCIAGTTTSENFNSVETGRSACSFHQLPHPYLLIAGGSTWTTTRKICSRLAHLPCMRP
jgi:hypothetical protein